MKPLNKGQFTLVRNAMAEFGLGQKTGIDLPNRSPGIQTAVRIGPGRRRGKSWIRPLVSLIPIHTDATGSMCQRLPMGQESPTSHVVRGIYGNDEEGNLGSLIKSIEPFKILWI